MGAQRKVENTAEKLTDSAVQMEESAVQMERDTARMERRADRRTELAADRTVFAAERTYAAWVRTGLVAMASAVGAKAALSGVLPEWLVIATGTMLVLFAAFCYGAAVWRNLFPGPPPPVPDVPRIHSGVLVFLNGFLVLIALAALFGIWFGRAAGG